MFERWRTFELTPDGYRETVNGIGDTLRKLGVSDKEAEAGKQLVEHIYSLQLSRRPEVCEAMSIIRCRCWRNGTRTIRTMSGRCS